MNFWFVESWGLQLWPLLRRIDSVAQFQLLLFCFLIRIPFLSQSSTYFFFALCSKKSHVLQVFVHLQTVANVQWLVTRHISRNHLVSDCYCFFFGHLSTVTMNYKSTRHAFCVNHLITFSRYTTEYDQKISKKDARLMYNISESAYCHVERKQTTQRWIGQQANWKSNRMLINSTTTNQYEILYKYNNIWIGIF